MKAERPVFPKSAFASLALALLVAGCATTQQLPSTSSKPPAPNVNLAGYPPAFRSGYADGCGSVHSSARMRDEPRFKTDAMYAQGWRDGYDICKSR
jgi:hypothetical protein